ncbi:hypothetical protein [Ureibacillus terrenus]|uniref:Sporulation protein YqfC n=2 Tax=Ureibacillus TaxID=160795 RepID=A0A540V4V7_9BACL|nr:hypothetical protein [Ureibacillus terrenus]MED3661522.1 hypothetical protein [Ureibacillus terrenus]MED3763990.1 hypothetical protein [Ureibacillus terrenus]TQE91790.1 hypothetical protein FKZ59_03460 [Ureibacillus terrenus]
MKKLFQYDPFIEMLNCRQLRIIGDYKFLEASEHHCKFYYEGFLVTIEAGTVHINVLKDEEILVHVDELKYFEMKRQVNENEIIR